MVSAVQRYGGPRGSFDKLVQLFKSIKCTIWTAVHFAAIRLALKGKRDNMAKQRIVRGPFGAISA